MKFALSNCLVVLSFLASGIQAQEVVADASAVAPATPTKWDCVRNATGKSLTVMINTNTGSLYRVLPPGTALPFYYYNYHTKAVVVAYEYGKDNLFAASEFPLVDQTGSRTPSCIVIKGKTPFGSSLEREAHDLSPGNSETPVSIAPIVP